MPKIKKIEHINETTGKKWYHDQYLFFCEGCGYEHAFALKSEGGNHDFNGNLENPTISPSLLYDFTPGKRCHSFINDGRIQFLGDCWHQLKNKTIVLPNIT